jgi:hypothetical protein
MSRHDPGAGHANVGDACTPTVAGISPAFEAWLKMSEQEQDALLDRMAPTQRRPAMLLRCRPPQPSPSSLQDIAGGLCATLAVRR